MSCFVEIKNMHKKYDHSGALVIDELNIQRGHIVAVAGPNGVGKTTLLNLLALLYSPTSGSIKINGIEASHCRRTRAKMRKHITMVAQHPYMFGSCVASNVSFGLRARKIENGKAVIKVKSALEKLGLKGFENRYAQELSAGETRRVAIARAIVLEPELLLLDEPMANVDKANVGYVIRTIQAIRNELNTTIVLATHDVDVGRELADVVIELSK